MMVAAGHSGTTAIGGTGGGGTGGTGGSGGSGGTGGGSTGGSGGSGGGAGHGTSGAPATGGSSGSGGTGGSAGSGRGGTGMGGMSTAGTSGTAGGGAGMAPGGMSAGGGAGKGGAGTLAGPVDPSSGCGKASPPTGSSGQPLMAGSHKYYVKLPTAYDASKPYVLFFMFNPTGNPITWAEQNAGFEQTAAKDNWIRVYPDPASESNGWGASDVSFFQPLYDAVTAAYCVDKARVFAGGESSGGDFVSILGCEHADKLRGVAPCATKDVSQYPLDATKRKCTGEVTSVVIQSPDDNVVGFTNGPKTKDFYVALNHCGTMSSPVDGYTDTLSNCVEYQGCDDGYPVYWCQHHDPEYSGTHHGWPHFAAKFLYGMWSMY